MLVDPLSWNAFSLGQKAHKFVVAFSMMNQLMAHDIIKCSEESSNEYEAKIISICLWFLQAEPESLWVHVITHHDQSPNPHTNFKDDKEVKWNFKSFIFLKNFSWFDWNVFIVTLSKVILSWRDQINKEHWKIELVRGNHQDDCDQDHNGITEIWSYIS